LCKDLITNEEFFYTKETDIRIVRKKGNVTVPWFYDTNVSHDVPSAKYDLYSVVLHELGHAHFLGHVINNEELMHYSESPGFKPAQNRNLLHTSSNIIEGGIYEMAKSYEINSTNCSNIYKATPLYSGSCYDLYSGDKPEDNGLEPSTVDYLWMSKDIWVRQQNDGFTNQEHQNAEYYGNSSNHDYVYVRVKNRGFYSSFGTEKVRLYWTKAGIYLPYPTGWDGTLFANTNLPIGGLIGEASLPIIQPGEEVIVSFSWNPPNPADYSGQLTIGTDSIWSDEPHHFCLMSRINSAYDPIHLPESDVRKNNNVVTKNISIVDLNPSNFPTRRPVTGGIVLVGDASGNGGKYCVNFLNSNGYPKITNEAEVIVTLSPELWQKWERGGLQGENIRILNRLANKIIIENDNAYIKNLTFPPNERNLMHIGFHFLSGQNSANNEFEFHAIQKNCSTGDILGGETYKIFKNRRRIFTANAGNDRFVNLGDTITIAADDIDEPALYNWYDSEGNLIYQGKDLEISNAVAQKYKLEVISNLDGYKDYADVEIKINPSFLDTIVPNPASNSINIGYNLSGATSAYIMIVGYYGSGNENLNSNYILDPNSDHIFVDINSYPFGLYTVYLVINGEIVDSEILEKY
jgi:hypothetical protein